MAPSSIIDTYTGRDGLFSGYDHVTWYVSNAKQVASFFCTRFGFAEIAYRGLETGSKDICSHVVRKNDVTMVFTCALRATASVSENRELVAEIHNHVSSHGDAVRDVAFAVDDVAAVYDAAIANGAGTVLEPLVMSDKFGQVSLAAIAAHGDTTHTLVDRSQYAASRFMPGFEPTTKIQPHLDTLLGDSGILNIDHCVGNQGWNQMEEVCRFYEKALGFHRFWSVDDTQVCTEFSALRSTVMASPNDIIKMPINEPARGRKKSQIEEFVEFYNGSGIQHIALRTNNIIETITNLRQRGVEFISAPATYYKNLSQRLASSQVNVKEDLRILQDLDILVDFDDKGYLLQLFTKPLVDRPTVFIEIIQRENFEGFGAGNFKSLFESIEQDQALRGTL